MWGRLQPASACGVASARLPQVPASRSSGTEVPRRLKPAPHGLSLYSANQSTRFGRLSWGDDDSKEIADFQDQEANILSKTWQDHALQHSYLRSNRSERVPFWLDSVWRAVVPHGFAVAVGSARLM